MIQIPTTDQEWSTLITATLSKLPPLDTLMTSPHKNNNTRSLTPVHLAQYIDHTLLKPEATSAQVEALCNEAVQYQFISVCVRPDHVETCQRVFRPLAASTNGPGKPSEFVPRIAAVVGFHEGTHETATKVSEARAAVRDGAAELDMVLNQLLLVSGSFAKAFEDVNAVRLEADEHRKSIVLKVILETSQLTAEQIVAGSLIAVLAGADFVKTSTGFLGRGATVGDVRIMRAVCDLLQSEGWTKRVKIKASGGIRTAEDCLRMVGEGAERIGASSGVKIVEEYDKMIAGQGHEAPAVAAIAEDGEGGY